MKEKMLGTFSKADRVLELYTTERPEWGVNELARALGQPPSSVHLLLSSLSMLGLLHRTAAGRYRLGFRLLALSQVLLATTPWREVAFEEMCLLESQLGETVFLGALDGGIYVRAKVVAGRRAGAISPTLLGEKPPAYATAGGKLLMAFRDPAYPLRRAQTLSAFTPSTITDPEELSSELRRIRERGLAFNIGEHQPGHYSLAAPVRNHNGEVIAALTVCIPPERFEAHKEGLIAAAVQTAGRISARIGYSPELGAPAMHWASVQGQDTPHPVVPARFPGH